MKSSAIPTTRRPGRPSANTRSNHRNRLLGAAERLISGDSPEEPTLRRIAHLAEVTPALAHYYFGSQEGLIDSLLTERIAPRIEDLVTAASARAGQPQLAITFLMQRGLLLAGC
ncbi:MAG: TetR family transcriptional regulator [Pseudomonadota bacterium]